MRINWEDVVVGVLVILVAGILTGIGKLMWRSGAGILERIEGTLVEIKSSLETITQQQAIHGQTLTALSEWQEGHNKQDDERHETLLGRLDRLEEGQ